VVTHLSGGRFAACLAVIEETIKQIADGFGTGSDLPAVYIGDEFCRGFVGSSHAASEVLADKP